MDLHLLESLGPSTVPKLEGSLPIAASVTAQTGHHPSSSTAERRHRLSQDALLVSRHFMEVQRVTSGPKPEHPSLGLLRIPVGQSRRCWKRANSCRQANGFRKQETGSSTLLQATATLQPAERPRAIPHLEGKVRYIGTLLNQWPYSTCVSSNSLLI